MGRAGEFALFYANVPNLHANWQLKRTFERSEISSGRLPHDLNISDPGAVG
jgi:hypothetical protein